MQQKFETIGEALAEGRKLSKTKPIPEYLCIIESNGAFYLEDEPMLIRNFEELRWEFVRHQGARLVT